VEYPPNMMYETYDEMDYTLARLHAPKFESNETVSLGPFGVFDGIKERAQNNSKNRGASKNAQQRDKPAKKRKRKNDCGENNNSSKKKKKNNNTHHTRHRPSVGSDDYDRSISSIVTPVSLNDTPSSNTMNEDDGVDGNSLLSGNGNGFEEFFSSLTQEFPTSELNSGMLMGNSTDPLGDGVSYQVLQDELSALLSGDTTIGAVFQSENQSAAEEQPTPSSNRPTPAPPAPENNSAISAPATTVAAAAASASPFTAHPTPNTPASVSHTPCVPPASTPYTQAQGFPTFTSQTSTPAVTPAAVPPPPRLPANATSTNTADNNNNSKSTTTSSTPKPFKSSLFVSTKIPQMPFSDNKFGFPTTSLHFTPQARYLLDHYIKNVTRIMSVVVHPKNPWKTIYLPRAVSAVGDLVGLGHTASARNALLHALLAVSAFHLQSKFSEESEGRKHYLGLGLQLKAEAYTWLSECLMKDLASQKYKDVITAVLSMVSIDVIWGSMTDCKVHLSACRSIVNMRCKLRPKISDKAAVLHRIAGFLSLMQNSTSLSPADITGMDSTKEFSDQWLDVRLEDLGVSEQDQKGTMQLPSLAYMNEESEFQEYWLQYKQSEDLGLSEDFYKKELISTHSLYGIPDSLMLLFNRTIKLTKLVLYYRYKGESLPKDITKQCSDLEGALVTWQNRYDVNKNGDFKGDLKEAVKHHTLSFHESLIIYYYRLVRDLNPAILQTHISTVLDHLEQIQVLNRSNNTPICVPLVLPGFIAACETLPQRTDLRNRFLTWMDHLAADGLGTYYTSRRVVEEVWRRRDEDLDRPNWWNVIVDWKVNIMLC
jgi:hypothetical protein